MYCLECHKLINRVINYKNIFKTNKHHICESCFNNYLLIQKLEVIPVDNYLLYLNILFDNFQNSDAMSSFLKPYYLYYLKNFKNLIILYFDTFDEKVYNVVNLLNMQDILIVTLKSQIKGGNIYDDWSNRKK